MPSPRCSDREFISIWNSPGGGSSDRVAKSLGIAAENVRRRRRRIERDHGVQLLTRDTYGREAYDEIQAPAIQRRADLQFTDGVAIVFSDCHWWPGRGKSAANDALLKLIDRLAPGLLIANGDLADFARLCRQAPAGWEKSNAPTVAEELAELRLRMDEIYRAAPRRCTKRRTRGNHDNRMDRALQVNAPEFEGVAGFSLSDHLKDWPESWSIHLNAGTTGYTVVKHRHHNGIHATYNNVLKSGVNIVTGHLHRLKVEYWGDYRGRRYAVDTGTLADPEGPQFDYAEDNPTPHASGFGVLTFENGRLLPPELVEVIEGRAYFRGAAV